MVLTAAIPVSVKPGLLADYLAGRFTYHGRDDWIVQMAEGRVRLNGARCRADTMVTGGDTVSYEPLPFDEPPADRAFGVVYEDEWLLAVDKPGNLLVHRSGRAFTTNLMHLVRTGYRTAPLPDAGAVNRIDRETSGIVLVAKESRYLKHFTRLFGAHAVRKEYCAIVHNRFDDSLAVIDRPVGPDAGSAIRYKHAIDEQGGKPARTSVESVEHLGDAFSVVRLVPLTGRTHQIRVHCRCVGNPVVGDKLYSMDEVRYQAWRDDPAAHPHGLPMDRQALHCASVTLHHPFLNREVCISAALPQDMRAFIEKHRVKPGASRHET